MKRVALAMLPIISLVACGEAAKTSAEDAWARDTIGRTANAAVFMTIRSASQDRLIGASSAIARKVDLMTFHGGPGAMRMSYIDAIDLPARQMVRLDPSGLHVWLEGLNRPLRAGQTFPLRLRLEKAGELQVSVKVIGPSDVPPASKP